MVYCFGDVDAFGADVGVMKELRGAKEVGEEGVVVETPDTVGTGWFEQVQYLDVAG